MCFWTSPGLDMQLELDTYKAEYFSKPYCHYSIDM